MFKLLMNEYSIARDTPYQDEEHKRKAYASFMLRNEQALKQAMEIALRAEELGLQDKLAM